MTITEQWAEQLDGTGVVVHAMHPGWADTKGVQNWMPVFRKTTRPIIRDAEQGADTIVWMGAAPEVGRVDGQALARPSRAADALRDRRRCGRCEGPAARVGPLRGAVRAGVRAGSDRLSVDAPLCQPCDRSGRLIR